MDIYKKVCVKCPGFLRKAGCFGALFLYMSISAKFRLFLKEKWTYRDRVYSYAQFVDNIGILRRRWKKNKNNTNTFQGSET